LQIAIDDLCERAGKLVAEEHHAEAHDLLVEAARLDPLDARPLIGLGEICRSLDYHDLASNFFRKAIEVDPGDFAPKISLAMGLAEVGKNREAIALLREVEPEVARKRPDTLPFIWGELAVNALHLGNPREAIPLLERYNEVQGRQAWGYENLGRALGEAGDLAKAEAAYRTAIEIMPESALAHLGLGQLLVRTGRRAEGETHLQAFRRLRSLQTEARLLEQGVNRDPRSIENLVRLAHVRALLGQYGQALVPLERAMRLAPGDDRIRRLHEGVKQQAEKRR